MLSSEQKTHCFSFFVYWMKRYIFLGVSLATLGSACCGLRYRFGASLRYALG
ncbi:MAG: hypothetical protein NZ455_10730 [Bacteroidia bacterium]|nr:hypothetical protein [Bacteroidia bacterium]